MADCVFPLRYVKKLFSGTQTLVAPLVYTRTTLQLNQVPPKGQHSPKRPTMFI